MIIVNQCAEGNSAYILSIGEECQSEFKVFANSRAEAIELLAEHLLAKGNTDAYFNALEVNLMASGKGITMSEFADAYDLYYCSKFHIYLPDLCIEEVSV